MITHTQHAMMIAIPTGSSSRNVCTDLASPAFPEDHVRNFDRLDQTMIVTTDKYSAAISRR